MYERIEPTLIEANSLHGDRYSHPAYAHISAFRMNGSADDLFGSHVGNYGSVTIEISAATLTENLGQEWIHPGGARYIRVEMSEAQWVAFVSRMNSGGTPCTLRTRGGETVPQLPPQKKVVEALEDQLETMIKQNERKVDEYIAKVREALEGKVSKKLLDEVMSNLSVVRGHGESTRRFHVEQLTAHKEKLATEAAIEFDALVEATTTRLGLASIDQLGAVLAADPAALLQLAHGPKADDHE